MQRDVNRRLKDTIEELKRLGPVRGSASEQRQYLTQVAVDFQVLVNKAKANQYMSDRFFKKDANRLLTKIANRGEEFSQDLEKYGRKHEFAKLKDDEETESDKPKTSSCRPLSRVGRKTLRT